MGNSPYNSFQLFEHSTENVCVYRERTKEQGTRAVKTNNFKNDTQAKHWCYNMDGIHHTKNTQSACSTVRCFPISLTPGVYVQDQRANTNTCNTPYTPYTDKHSLCLLALLLWMFTCWTTQTTIPVCLCASLCMCVSVCLLQRSVFSCWWWKWFGKNAVEREGHRGC